MKEKPIYVKHNFFDFMLCQFFETNSFSNYFCKDSELAPHYNALKDIFSKRLDSDEPPIPDNFDLFDYYVIAEYRKINFGDSD